MFYVYIYSYIFCFQYFVLVVFIFVAEFLVGALAFIYRESLKHTLREELRDGLLHHYNMTSRGPNSLVQIWDNIQINVIKYINSYTYTLVHIDLC